MQPSRYPHLAFQRRWSLSEKAAFELGQCDAIVTAISNTPILPEYHARLLHISLTKGAQATTAIEGNTLTDEEIERVAAGKSLPPSKEYQEREVRNILEAFNTLLLEAVRDGKSEPISEQLLRRFHYMIGHDLGEHFDAIPGELRRDHRIVGPYRPPGPEDVPVLIDQLSEWLLREFHFDRGQTFAQAVIQAIITHVYIEWIHPFADGNGRTGRLVEFYILLRAGTPDIASHILSNFYNETRTEYYRQIDKANKSRDLSGFIEYAIQGLRDGLLKTLTLIQQNQFEITWRQLIYDRFAAKPYVKKSVFIRQRELALALPMEGSSSLEQIGLINPRIAQEYGRLSERTLARDLAELELLNIVVKDGDRYRSNARSLTGQTARRQRRETGSVD